MTKKPKPPADLRRETAAWWRVVTRDYDLEMHHLRMLEAACRAWDRMEQAREILARDGLTCTTADNGLKAHPCVGIERDFRLIPICSTPPKLRGHQAGSMDPLLCELV